MPAPARRTPATLPFTLLLLVARPGQALAQEAEDAGGRPASASQDAEEPAKASSRFAVGAELTVAYTSNAFHEQARRTDDFDSKNDPGERYEDMEGPADLYARPAVGVKWSRKLAAKRKLRLSADAEFTAYARNSIADYVRLAAATDYDLGKRDQIGLGIDFIPRRFKKNYYNDVAGDKVFDRAYYMQLAPTPSYRHRWTKRWATEVEYTLSLRRYEDPFPHRDTTTHSIVLVSAHDVSDGVVVKVGPEAAFARVPQHLEFGAEVDRSHRDLGVLGAVELDLPRGWAIEGELEYRHEGYLSDDPADDGHYHRGDDVIDFDAVLAKRMSGMWYLSAILGYTKVLSDRIDATIDSDEYGYTELVLGLGGQARF